MCPQAGHSWQVIIHESAGMTETCRASHKRHLTQPAQWGSSWPSATEPYPLGMIRLPSRLTFAPYMRTIEQRVQTSTKGHTMKRQAWTVNESSILSRAEVAAVLADLDRRAKRSVNTRQTRAVFALATFCGLRASEIGGLRLRDCRFGIRKPVIRLPASICKGHKSREIPLWRLPSALAILQGWHTERVKVEVGQARPSDLYVCTQAQGSQGHPVTRQALRRRFIAALSVLGEERQDMLTLHSGRHTCASHLLAAGWPLPLVRDMLGHANLSTTSIYSHIVVDDETPRDPFAFVKTA